MSSSKWTPERLAKFQATMAAKAKARNKVAKAEKVIKSPPKGGGITKDAIVYLTHAENYIYSQLSSGRLKKMDYSHKLTLLALSVLKGEK